MILISFSDYQQHYPFRGTVGIVGSDSFLHLKVQVVWGEGSQLLQTVPFMDFIGSHDCSGKWTDNYKHVTSSIVLSMLLTEKRKDLKKQESFQSIEENGDNPILREFSGCSFFSFFMHKLEKKLQTNVCK